MRKLKGIIINGEWLGENVVINGMFRTISSMAPFVMLEFVKLINQIDKLDEAVTIKKFNFLDNNSIEIEFTNSQIDGLADLYFHLHNGIPELTDKNLTFFAPNSPVKEVISKDNEEECIAEDVKEIIEKLPTIDKKQDDVVYDAEISEEADVKEIKNETCISEEKIEENPENTITDLYEEKIQPEEIKQEVVSAENMSEALEKTQNAISMLVNDLAKNAQNIPPVQIQVLQAPAQQVPTEQVPTEQKNSEPLTQTISQAVVQENIEARNEIEEHEENISNNLAESFTTEPEFKKEDCIIESVFENESENATTADEIEAIEETFAENNNVNTMESKDVETIDFKEEEIEALKEQPTEAEVIAETDELAESNEELNSNTNEEEIQECLAGFYEKSKSNEIEEICAQNSDSIVMQAMLNEMLVLKEELNKLKEEPQKPDVTSFWSDNDKKGNYIDDDDADFRIMGSEKRINASILDEDMFVAGNKLYKWGDMLYLEE